MAELTKMKTLLAGLGTKSKSGWGTVLTWLVWRALTVLLAYVTLVMTAVVLIPQIAMQLHSSTLAVLGTSPTVEGMAAFWYAPLLFVILAILLIEYKVAAWLWAQGSRSVEKAKRKALGEFDINEVSVDRTGVAPAASKGKKQLATKGLN